MINQRLRKLLPPVLDRCTACRFILSLSLMVIIMGLPALSGAQQACLPNGDVDRNGSVTAADALLAFQQALGLAQLTACQRDIADVFPQPVALDGSITASDALCIFQKALSLPSCLDTLPSTNQPPVADAGFEQFVFGNDVVILSGSGSDTDGTIVRYRWMQTSGPTVVLSGADTPNASFTAPEVTLENLVEELEFQLTVTDDDGASDTAVVLVGVIYDPFTNENEPPTANAGFDQTVSENTLVTLSGSGNDPDGFIVGYLWFQLDGTPVELIGWDTPNPSFFAPEVDSDEELVFELTVFDDVLLTPATDTVTITVLNAVSNTPPVADAGRDQTVDANTPVTLSGSGSDSDGTIVSYRWTQTSGTPVALSGANTPTTSFAAPDVDSDEDLVFQLTVTDDSGARANDEVTVTIQSSSLTATISGVVKNYETGDEIPGATIRITQFTGGVTSDLGITTTGNSGEYNIQVNANPGRANVNAVTEGFAPQSVIVHLRGDIDDVPADLAMLPVQVETAFQPTQDAEEMHFSVPANSLMTTNGAAPTGEVTAMITVLDASSDPAVMPGDFMSLDADMETSAPIESFGAMNVEFMDENGEPLNLGNGREAMVMIPLAERRDPRNAPRSMPLFYWSDAMGSWIEEGEATLQQDENGQWAYVGSVNHFSTWNADIIYETVQLGGCVEDIDGNPAGSARVSAIGRDYIGSSTVLANPDGQFKVPVRRNSQVLISAVLAAHSNTELVNTGGAATQQLGPCLVLSDVGATIKLTWSEQPRDLASHLYGPDGQGETFHVYWRDMNVLVGETIINHDVDDTNGYGPEIITIPRFPFPGTYHYLVEHWAGSSTISASPARVELNLGGEIYIFSPETASGSDKGDGTVWAVFKIEVDQNFMPKVISVQEFRDRLPDSDTPS